MDCVFCKIVAGEIPSYKVYENEAILAFLSIEPLNPGHVLVIPKKHYRWVWDVPDIGANYQVAGRVAHALKRALATDWVVSLVLGEEVPHAHVWLVPRLPGDGHGAAVDLAKIRAIGPGEMSDIARRIKENLV